MRSWERKIKLGDAVYTVSYCGTELLVCSATKYTFAFRKDGITRYICADDPGVPTNPDDNNLVKVL
jgi:hypothetical protein